MEKASGELSLTVVTIVAIAAIAGLVTILWNPISGWISGTMNNVTGTSINLNGTK